MNVQDPSATPAAPDGRWSKVKKRVNVGIAIAVAALFLEIGFGVSDWLTRPEAVEAADMALPLPDKPSIAVLAFNNLGIDEADAFLAESFSEDILTALSKLSGLFVISRTTTFTYKDSDATVKQIAEELGIRYVLEGSFQRDGDRIRVTAQLIDAIGGQHVWADNYDRDLDDLFAVKDDITLNIVTNISAELVTGERDRVLGRETDNLEAWLLFQQSLAEFSSLDPSRIGLAINLAERAIAIEPNFVSAITVLGHIYTNQDRFEDALTLSDRALELDPSHAYANAARSDYHLRMGQVDLAVEFAQKAVELDPNDFVSHYFLGSALAIAAKPAEAVRAFLLAIRLSPVTPLYVVPALGVVYLNTQQYEEAVAAAEQVLDRPDVQPGNAWVARLVLATAFDRLGRGDDAQAQMELAMEAQPETSTIEFMRNEFRVHVDQDHTEGLLDTWRRLGMPED
ncbi:MAG: tetratricopeptide repeat protein [Alphaproteobacteria bacterium]|jgi:adenylate cyclase|nr:tetratricopeptide repeat protein [Alphaproteobacteria bacterium]MBT5859752.1 tetratricopeptide repeat protein [Alphaproteobacteria bacterium]